MRLSCIPKEKTVTFREHNLSVTEAVGRVDYLRHKGLPAFYTKQHRRHLTVDAESCPSPRYRRQSSRTSA
jgi:hypothetical protein